MNLLEKLNILTPLQKLPKNVGRFGQTFAQFVPNAMLLMAELLQDQVSAGAEDPLASNRPVRGDSDEPDFEPGD